MIFFKKELVKSIVYICLFNDDHWMSYNDALKEYLPKPLVLAHGTSAGHWSKKSLRYIKMGGKWEGRFH